MANILNARALALLLVVVFLAVALIAPREVFAATTYTLHGAYYEDGSDAGAINITMTRVNQGALTFELNGTYLANASTTVTVFNFNLGVGNQSRTFYTVNGAAEEIYVYKPTDNYFYSYFFEVLDYIGLDWGYLESVRNVDGTDRVIERWTLGSNELPFTFHWGDAYAMRIVCNRGIYTYAKPYVAGATTSFTLSVTPDMFPIVPTDINGLAVIAQRVNITTLYAYYRDDYSQTNWTYFEIYEYGEASPIYSYNSTSQLITVYWYEAGSDIDYYVKITILHSTLGTKYWSFPCPAPISVSNPFDALSLLGEFPIAANQVIPVALLVVVSLCFSWYYLPFGLIVLVLIAAIEVWLGWLAIGWTWLGLSGSIILILALAEAKQREIVA